MQMLPIVKICFLVWWPMGPHEVVLVHTANAFMALTDMLEAIHHLL